MDEIVSQLSSEKKEPYSQQFQAVFWRSRNEKFQQRNYYYNIYALDVLVFYFRELWDVSEYCILSGFSVT